MRMLDVACVTSTGGIAGDFRGRPGRRQVTVLAREGWERACGELGLALPWTARRANLFVEGVELPGSTGTMLLVGNAVLEVTGESAPCARMDEVADGLREALGKEWRGGVTCRVVHGGEIRLGDRVTLFDPGAALRA